MAKVIYGISADIRSYTHRFWRKSMYKFKYNLEGLKLCRRPILCTATVILALPFLICFLFLVRGLFKNLFSPSGLCTLIETAVGLALCLNTCSIKGMVKIIRQTYLEKSQWDFISGPSDISESDSSYAGLTPYGPRILGSPRFFFWSWTSASALSHCRSAFWSSLSVSHRWSPLVKRSGAFRWMLALAIRSSVFEHCFASPAKKPNDSQSSRISAFEIQNAYNQAATPLTKHHAHARGTNSIVQDPVQDLIHVAVDENKATTTASGGNFTKTSKGVSSTTKGIIATSKVVFTTSKGGSKSFKARAVTQESIHSGGIVLGAPRVLHGSELANHCLCEVTSEGAKIQASQVSDPVQVEIVEEEGTRLLVHSNNSKYAAIASCASEIKESTRKLEDSGSAIEMLALTECFRICCTISGPTTRAESRVTESTVVTENEEDLVVPQVRSRTINDGNNQPTHKSLDLGVDRGTRPTVMERGSHDARTVGLDTSARGSNDGLLASTFDFRMAITEFGNAISQSTPAMTDGNSRISEHDTGTGTKNDGDGKVPVNKLRVSSTNNMLGRNSSPVRQSNRASKLSKEERIMARRSGMSSYVPSSTLNLNARSARGTQLIPGRAKTKFDRTMELRLTSELHSKGVMASGDTSGLGSNDITNLKGKGVDAICNGSFYSRIKTEASSTSISAPVRVQCHRTTSRVSQAATQSTFKPAPPLSSSVSLFSGASFNFGLPTATPTSVPALIVPTLIVPESATITMSMETAPYPTSAPTAMAATLAVHSMASTSAGQFVNASFGIAVGNRSTSSATTVASGATVAPIRPIATPRISRSRAAPSAASTTTTATIMIGTSSNQAHHPSQPPTMSMPIPTARSTSSTQGRVMLRISRAQLATIQPVAGTVTTSLPTTDLQSTSTTNPPTATTPRPIRTRSRRAG
ncbi:hypothetical protein BGZ83_001395, partial [Gryganskiella cystojenkinii]